MRRRSRSRGALLAYSLWASTWAALWLPAAGLAALGLAVARPDAVWASPLTLAEALEEASRQNPELQAAQLAFRAASEGPTIQAGAYDWWLTSDASYSRTIRVPSVITEPDDSQTVLTNLAVRRNWSTGTEASAEFEAIWQDLGIDANPVFPRSTFWRPRLTLGVSQALARDLGREVNETPQDVARMEAELVGVAEQELASALAARIASGFIAAARTAALSEVQTVSREVARVQLDSTKQLAAAGRVAVSEALPLEQAMATREIELEQLAARRADALAELARSMGREVTRDTLPTVGPTLPPSIAALQLPTEQEALDAADRNWSVLTASIRERQQSRRLVQTDNATLPDVRLQASASLSGNDVNLGSALADVVSADNPQFTVGVSVAIPLVNQAAVAQHAQAQFEQQRAEQQARAAQQDARAEAARLHREASRAERVGLQATNALRFAEGTLVAERDRFAAGLTTNLAVLQALQQTESARVQAVEAELDRAAALVALHHHLGSLLSNLGVDVVRRGAAPP